MTSIDITDKNNYPALRLRADELIREDRVEECFALAKELEATLTKIYEHSNTNPESYREVEQITYELKWSVLYLYSETAILALFQNHLVDMLGNSNVDIMARLKTFLVGYVDMDERDAFKHKIIHALETSQEELTEEGVKKDGKIGIGTVANWLLDYRVALGTQAVSAADLANYLVGSENAKSLSSESRERLKSLLEINERLKLSSATPEGHESPIVIDSEDNKGVIIDGLFYKSSNIDYANALRSAREILAKVNNQANPAPSAAIKSEPESSPVAFVPPAPKPKVDEKHAPINNRQAVELYEQNPEMRQAISEAENKILSTIGEGQFDVRVEMGTAIAQEDRARVIALLIVLAKTQDLFTLIESDNGFIDWLKDQYGPVGVAQFKKQPDDPLFYSLWLQQLLEERLKMSAGDAAKAATLLANLVGRRYLKAAYLDTSTGKFAWAPIKQQKDRLIFTQ